MEKVAREPVTPENRMKSLCLVLGLLLGITVEIREWWIIIRPRESSSLRKLMDPLWLVLGTVAFLLFLIGIS
jgi:hypothetical protein